MKCQKLRFK